MKTLNIETARAKVNLALHVVNKRRDGFHELDSLVCFPSFGDEIICERSSVPTLSISGRFSTQLPVANNIILKILNEISSSNRSLSVHLKKNIPVAAGLGGGSADGAAVIRSFISLWGENYFHEKNFVKFGADIPVCLNSSFQRMMGLGEKVQKLKSDLEFYILLVNTGNQISTKEVFSRVEPKYRSKLDKMSKYDQLSGLISYLKKQRNDLEEVACNLDYNLRYVINYLQKLPGCEIVRLSGSGGTIFSIFESRMATIEAYRKILVEKKYWWVSFSAVNLADPGHNIIT